ncbi:MAG: hypothetical protein QG574_3825 [Cyanobacteriota bacterium erpe_2018_sw_21hr_WHONDRS-SW48-000092_B_bin.40]|jgi:hypothetical protein|nr:hypothetical protein [Cyanobacteriota bacterium erpe_2018_sw_21hr_WHONDRS-SW48-000092_B_bin.40]
MSILIGKHEFDGPFNDVDSLEEREGLYVVLNFKDEQYELIHVAQADNIRERIQLLPSAKPDGKVLFAALYTPRFGKRERTIMVEDIESDIDSNEKTQDIA